MKRFSKTLVFLLLVLLQHFGTSQDVPVLQWKTKTLCLYDKVFTFRNELTIKERLLSTYCSITSTDDGSFHGTMCFSLPGIRAGTLAYTSIAYLMFNPATNAAVKYNHPQSAFSAAVTGTLYGYAFGQNTGFFSLYTADDTLGKPWTSGFWIQQQCTSSVLLRFITAYGNRQPPDTGSWSYSSTMPSIWSVLGLITQGATINCALVYGLRRGIDNGFGWFIRTYSHLNFTRATITADTICSNGTYYTPNLTDLAILSVLLKTTLFPQSIISCTLWLQHIQKSIIDEPEQMYGGSLEFTGITLKGKLSVSLVESSIKHKLNLVSSLEWRPLFQTHVKTISNYKNPLQIALVTNWKTINSQADIFSISGTLEYEQFIIVSIAIKQQWNTQGSTLYIDPGISIPFLAGKINGSCHFCLVPESSIPELKKLEVMLILHN